MTEPLEPTETDLEDIARMHAGSEGADPDAPPSYHTLLEVWSEVLKPSIEQAKEPVSPKWAHRMITTYPEITYASMDAFRDAFFSYIIGMRWQLVKEISTDEDCLSYTTAEDDARENAQHYRNVLTAWQEYLLRQELSWRCTHPDAAIVVAAISEVHKMFFGEQGLTAHLDTIGFDFTDEDRAELVQALDRVREEAR